MRLGVDAGGTFTDAVGDDGRVANVLSRRDDPACDVAEAVGALADVSPDVLAHGTTVATNALLERRGARVALVTTPGFADVIEIARQARPSLYDPFADRPEPLVPRAWRLEAGARLDATGAVLTPWDGTLPLVPDVDAIAVCLLHADLNAAPEQEVAAAFSEQQTGEAVYRAILVEKSQSKTALHLA